MHCGLAICPGAFAGACAPFFPPHVNNAVMNLPLEKDKLVHSDQGLSCFFSIFLNNELTEKAPEKDEIAHNKRG